jgi:hypothetical protein
MAILFRMSFTVLCPERILDTEASFKLFSWLLETQIRVDSSCRPYERNLLTALISAETVYTAALTLRILKVVSIF